MFYWLKVPEHQRNVLKFLWWHEDEPNQGIDDLRLRVHPFGSVWLASAANYAIKKTAEENRTKDIKWLTKLFVKKLCWRLSEGCGVNLIKSVTELLSKEGFHINKRLSNFLLVTESPYMNVNNLRLWIYWANVQEIHLRQKLLVWSALLPQINLFLPRLCWTYKPITRRGMPSADCAVYDPMGIISPVIVIAYLLMHELVRKKMNWYEELRDAQKWLDWKMSMIEANGLQLDRYVRPTRFKNASMQLHNFCDASQLVYGTVTYIWMMNDDEEVLCSFLLSRSRVALVKTLSIPRQELMTAVLAIQVDHMLRKELNVLLQETIYWTNSVIVLKCIEN